MKRSLLTYALAACVVLMGEQLGFAQAISGTTVKLRDNNIRDVQSGVTVTLVNEANNNQIDSRTTGDDGRFSFPLQNLDGSVRLEFVRGGIRRRVEGLNPEQSVDVSIVVPDDEFRPEIYYPCLPVECCKHKGVLQRLFGR